MIIAVVKDALVGSYGVPIFLLMLLLLFVLSQPNVIALLLTILFTLTEAITIY